MFSPVTSNNNVFEDDCSHYEGKAKAKHWYCLLGPEHEKQVMVKDVMDFIIIYTCIFAIANNGILSGLHGLNQAW